MKLTEKLDLIEKEVKDVFGLDEIFNKKRDKIYVDARKTFFYIARKYLKVTYQYLGNKYGKDHSTIIFYIKTFPDAYKYDPDLKNKVDSMDIIEIQNKSIDEKIAYYYARIEMLELKKRIIV